MSLFIPNSGLTALLEHSEGVKDALREKAEQGAKVARSIAPVLTGAFRDSIHVEQQSEGYAIVADSVDEQGNPDAAFIEFGTSATPAHGTLLHALEALGD